MPGGNFDDVLNVGPDGVVQASGPLDASVAEVSEMCVWVLQRDGADDAVGNAMGEPDEAGMPAMPDMAEMGGRKSGLRVFDLGTPEARWMFPLKHRFKPVVFSAGSATAMAIGIFLDSEGTQRAFWWSETVQLNLAAESADC